MDAIKILNKNLMTHDLSKKECSIQVACQLFWLAASSIRVFWTQPMDGGRESRFSSTGGARSFRVSNAAKMDIDLHPHVRLGKAGMSSD